MKNHDMNSICSQIDQYYRELIQLTQPFLDSHKVTALTDDKKQEYDSAVSKFAQFVMENDPIPKDAMKVLTEHKITQWQPIFKLNVYNDVETLVQQGKAEQAMRMVGLLLEVAEPAKIRAEAYVEACCPTYIQKNHVRHARVFYQSVYLVIDLVDRVKSKRDRFLASKVICWVNKAYPFIPPSCRHAEKSKSYKFSHFLNVNSILINTDCHYKKIFTNLDSVPDHFSY